MIMLFLILSTATLTAVNSDPIHGTISPPHADDPCALSVVAYSRNGQLVEVSPVTHDASFQFHRLALQDGDYQLQISGAVNDEYDPHFLRIANGHVRLFKKHQDPLVILGSDDDDRGNTTGNLVFQASRKTNYTRRKKPWKLKHLWAYRIRFLQLAAVAFVVWFPQFIRSLPKELRDELMGETDDTIGDVTAVFKALSGYKDVASRQSTSSSSARK